jgi:molybdate transport system substrate-binding protein
MRGILAALTAAGLGGCQAAPADEVTVYAAASLTDVFEELAAAYTEETGVTVVLSFDASSALRAQITEGAPADVFASADLANPQALADEGLTAGDPTVFTRNALTIVTPADAEAVDDWTDLATPGLRIVAAGEDVPITGYANELVANLDSHADAPAGFADAYAANVVSREDNVRAVLAKIELGEGDAAIVYETDAASTDAVSSLEVPGSANVVAEYAAVVVADAAPGAAEFVAWLAEEPAQRILASHGFGPPG